MTPELPIAPMWRRLAAYIFDIVLIVLVVGAVFYAFFGFDDALHQYLARDRSDTAAAVPFLIQRTLIRNTSLLIYLVYCELAEVSTFGGTLGKWLLSLRIVTTQGEGLSHRHAVLRNVVKPFSFPTVVGLLVAFRSPLRQTWHDQKTGTVVIYTPS